MEIKPIENVLKHYEKILSSHKEHQNFDENYPTMKYVEVLGGYNIIKYISNNYECIPKKEKE